MSRACFVHAPDLARKRRFAAAEPGRNAVTLRVRRDRKAPGQRLAGQWRRAVC